MRLRSTIAVALAANGKFITNHGGSLAERLAADRSEGGRGMPSV